MSISWRDIGKSEKELYQDLALWREFFGEAKELGKDTTYVEQRIIEIKQRIRYLQKKQSNYIPIVKYYGADCDSCVDKFPLPADIKTKEDAERFFYDNEYISYKPSPYDCTGQLFTNWFKIFRKPNGEFWCYHSYSRDV